MSLADSARWTSAKLVLQYPNDSTKPSPNTVATQSAPIGLSPPMPMPSQACRPCSFSGDCFTWSARPEKPPTSISATVTSAPSAGHDHEELDHLVVDRHDRPPSTMYVSTMAADTTIATLID